MFLDKIKLFNLRNLSNQEVSVCPEVNLLVGKNGQGKTNFLEAIHILSQAKSFRTSDLSELVKWGEDSASVYARVEKEGSSPYQLGLVITNSGKEAYLDSGKIQLFSDFVGKLTTVTFSPDDISLVKGGPQLRRRFLDRHLTDYDPSVLKQFVSYQKALKHKAQLLKEGVFDTGQLDTWDQILSESASQIESARSYFISRISEISGKLLKEIAAVDGKLSLALESNLFKSTEQPQAERYFEKFREGRAREIKFRSCITGPHRDDIAIGLDETDTRAYASQGQSRSIALVLKLGVIELIEKERGEAPVILLDDVESELDKGRSRAIFELLLKTKRQVFISGTDAGLAGKIIQEYPLSYRLFEVTNGVLNLVK